MIVIVQYENCFFFNETPTIYVFSGISPSLA